MIYKGKFGYNASRDIPVSPTRYFHQTLLKFNQYFASDADYLFFAKPIYEQSHLLSSINFAMHKIKTGTFTARTLKKKSLKAHLKGSVLMHSDNVVKSCERNTGILETVCIWCTSHG